MMPAVVRVRLAQILTALPVLEDCRGDIERHADFLWVHASLMAANDLPRANPTGTKQAEQELEKLLKLIEPLVLHVERMHGTSLDAMAEKGVRGGITLAHDLRRTGEAAWRGIKRLRALPATKGTGRPRKKRAHAVATAAVEVFEGLTGKKATIVGKPGKSGGPFLDFLEAVFEACEIGASPEAQARAVLMEKTPPKKGT
jgi:hypothetical protein